VTSNRFIPVKNKQVLCAVVFCACETIYVMSVVFYIIRAVSDFYFRLVIKETSYKTGPVKAGSYGERDLCLYIYIYMSIYIYIL
jgi:hypothetical protein